MYFVFYDISDFMYYSFYVVIWIVVLVLFRGDILCICIGYDFCFFISFIYVYV